MSPPKTVSSRPPNQEFSAPPALSPFMCLPLDEPIYSFFLANAKRARPVRQAPFVNKKGLVELRSYVPYCAAPGGTRAHGRT